MKLEVCYVSARITLYPLGYFHRDWTSHVDCIQYDAADLMDPYFCGVNCNKGVDLKTPQNCFFPNEIPLCSLLPAPFHQNLLRSILVVLSRVWQNGSIS